MLPRSNQRVRAEGERATLISDGFAWGRLGRAGVNRQAGTYEYGFARSADGWLIDGIVFRSSGAPDPR